FQTDEEGVLRSCLSREGKYAVVALGCYHNDQLIGVGEENKVLRDTVHCEAVADYDAQLRIVKDEAGVKKAAPCANLRRFGEDWTELGVRKSCVLRDRKSTVIARGCVLPDGHLLTIDKEQQVNSTTTVYCYASGRYGAYVHYKIDEQYIPHPKRRSCKNGKKEDTIWIEKGVRNVCSERNGQMTVVALGCVINDDIEIEVGEEQTLANGDVAKCQPIGEFGAEKVTTRGQVEETRKCKNGKALGEEWKDKNVRRTCVERNGEYVGVATGCYIGDKIIRIGKSHKMNSTLVYHCVVRGESDAKLEEEIPNTMNPSICSNGKKADERWSEGDIRFVYRSDEEIAYEEAIGCNLPGGGLLTIGGEHQIENHRTLICKRKDSYGAEAIYVDPHTPSEDVDCGEHNEPWEEDRFVKKCEAFDDVVAPKTFGCITPTGLYVLEGEEKEEEGVTTTCFRNENGKMEVKYEYTQIEE
ncbi:hypothetical protein PFISCL1PPCAC_3875, partial [Pristionchus fissidentatus]